MSLGNVIRKKRESLNLTLDYVSKEIGFSKPYLSTIETDRIKNPPCDELLAKLEKVLGFEQGLLLHIAHMQRMPADLREKFKSAESDNIKMKQFIKNLMHINSHHDQINSLITKSKLNFDEGQNFSKYELIPLITNISSSVANELKDPAEFGLYASEFLHLAGIFDPLAFAIEMNEDTMLGKYELEDVVVFSPSQKFSEGDDCFVVFNSRRKPLFRRIFMDSEGYYRLQPRNEKYLPENVTKKDVKGIYKAVINIRNL